MKYFLISIGVLIGSEVAATELLFFSGQNRDKFLGCLTCSEYDSNSVCNGYGPYGNEYSASGMWNEYAGFGNEYLPDSPWNEYSSSNSVPVLVDSEGKFYGYFTINEYRADAVKFSANLKQWFNSADGNLEKVRLRLCKEFSKIG